MVSEFIAFAKSTLGDAVSDVRASDRLTESAVCLVAPEQAYDRQLEKLLQGAGRPGRNRQADPRDQSRPQPDCRPRRRREAGEFRADAVQLLLDQARVLDGDKPQDPRAFAERLSRLFEWALRG